MLFAVEREALERKRRAASAFRHAESNNLLDGRQSSAALSSEVLPFLRLIIAQRGGQGHYLSPEQWQSVMELTTFARAGGAH